MTSKVAILRIDENETESLKETIRLIGGIDDLNTSERAVVIKVGVFSHKADNHTSVPLVKAIIKNVHKASKIFLAESDNYQGTGLERLQIWRELFTKRVLPVNLSDEEDSMDLTLGGHEMKLANVLFKPNAFVSTHILRTFERGSILKNLFGCVPARKKAKYHKTEVFCPLLADIYEAVGGIDLAVMDGRYLWRGAGDLHVPMGTIIVGRDAVAVETVGATLAGLKPERMPVTQEFVKRGLGEGDIRNIEIVGTPLENLQDESKLAVKLLKKKWKERGGAPKSWSPGIDSLIEKGFFNFPNKRTREDVAEALGDMGISTKGKLGVIATTLSRKVAKEKLKARKGREGWVYWKE